MVEAVRKLDFGERVDLDVGSLVAVPIVCLPISKPLVFSVYVKLVDGFTDQFVQLRSPGDQLTKERLDQFSGRLDTAYIPKGSWGVMVDELRKAELSGRSQSAEGQSIAVRNCVWGLLKDIEEKREIFPSCYKELSELSDRFAAGVMRLPFLRKSLIVRFQDPALYLSNHSINIALMATGVAQHQGLSLADSKVLFLACLLHNIGFVSIPTEVIGKTGSLSKDEWQYVRTHPYRGTRILEKMKAPREVVLVALQHHERNDGSGYPSGESANDIHLFAKICAVGDVYDAILSKRFHQDSFQMAEALSKLKAMDGKLDGTIIDILLGQEKD